MRYKVTDLQTKHLEVELNCNAADGYELVQILGVGTDKTRVVLKNPSLPPIDEVKDEQKETNND